MAILPQYQGSYYDLQRQQALANALMERALTPQSPGVGAAVGPYQVQARMSPLMPISQLGQALLSAKMGGQVAQGLNDLGQQQWGTLTNMLGGGAGMQSPQPNPDSASAGGVGADAIAGNAGGNGGSPAPNVGGAAVPSNAAGASGFNGGVGSSPLNPLGMNPSMAAMMMMQSPDKYWESQAAAYKPAEIVQQIRAAGIDPGSPLGRQIAQNMLAKQTAPDYVSGRPGGYMLNKSTGQMEQLPNVPEGFTAVHGPNGQWQIVPVQGALEAMGSSAAAKAGGSAQYQLKEVWDPSANGGQGGYVQQSVANVANAANGVPGFSPFQNAVRQVESGGRASAVNPASGAVGSMQTMPATAANPGFGVRPAANNSPAELQRVGADYATALQQKYGNDADAAVAYNWGPANADKWIAAGRPWKMLPDETKAYVGQVMTQQQNYAGKQSGALRGPMASQPQAGYTKGQEDLQGDLTKKWGVLNEANSQAQNTISYLQNIHDLASKAALGQQSDKLNYINGLLSLAGSEKATDMVTANNLLDKYSNQIVARLGTGGLGTDSARAILQSAYPNAHMTKGAIDEAVQNLVGASQMTQAKARLLQGDYNSRNPQAYNQKEMVFDQNADPRIWQYKNISDPNARKAFAKSVLQQDPNFGSKIKALESIGAL
jgi:hypothetical protein